MAAPHPHLVIPSTPPGPSLLRSLLPPRLSNMADRQDDEGSVRLSLPPSARPLHDPPIHLWRVGRKLSRYRDQTVVFLLVGRSSE